MYNRRYDKVFLMLRQETAGYSMGQRAPWGSCVMEIKNGIGRINLTVQGLRPIRRGRYAVYAIAGEREKQNNFFCGVLMPDAAGHGELKWDFNPDDLEGKDVTAEDLNTVAILAEADGGFSVPLSAYFGEKVEWRTYFKKTTSKKESNKVLKKTKEPSKDATLVAAEAVAVDMPSFELPKINWKKDEPKVESAKPIEEKKESHQAEQKKESAKSAVQKKESYHGSFRGLLEKFRQELDELQDTGVFSNKEMERIERAGRRNLQKEAVSEAVNIMPIEEETVETIENIAVDTPEDTVEAVEENKVEEAVEENEVAVEENEAEVAVDIPEKYLMLKENTDIYPFEEETTPWKCISLEEMVLLDDIPLSWMKDYFFLIPMKKYHHFIWKPEVEGYSFGVPGMDTSEDRAKAEKLGFSKFKKMQNGDLGYWILTKK